MIMVARQVVFFLMTGCGSERRQGRRGGPVEGPPPRASDAILQSEGPASATWIDAEIVADRDGAVPDAFASSREWLIVVIVSMILASWQGCWGGCLTRAALSAALIRPRTGRRCASAS